MIYFMREVDRPSRVKIGLSDNPRARLVKLRSDNSSRIDLVAVLEGEAERERELHQRFAHLCLRGEWFEDDGSIAALIEELRAAGDVYSPLEKQRDQSALRPMNLAAHLGISAVFASQVLRGIRNLSVPMTARAWAERGWKIGLLANATDADCDAFVRIVRGAEPKAEAA